MSPRSRLKIAVGRWEPLSLAVAVLVFVGLAVSGLVNVWIEAPDERALPGAADTEAALSVLRDDVADLRKAVFLSEEEREAQATGFVSSDPKQPGGGVRNRSRVF
jgi:hypothetical protein